MQSVRRTESRKAPQQDRSRATVEAILIATTHVLTEHGYDKATTNLIARRAGVSIGSLYQYFPNKESLIAALSEQHRRAVADTLLQRLEAARALPLRAALLGIIAGLLEHHSKDSEAHAIFAEQIPRLLGSEFCREMNRVIEQAIIAHLAQRPERLRPRNLELGVFMLVRGVEAITHAAVVERPDALADGQLEQELTDLVERYLVSNSSAV